MAPVNWRLAGPEVAFIVADTRAPVLFGRPGIHHTGPQHQPQLPSVRTVITTEGGAPDWQGFYGVARRCRAVTIPRCRISPSDIAIQLYTPGAPQASRRARCCRHANLPSTWFRPATRPSSRNGTDGRREDVSLVAMPIFHIGGSGWGVMGSYHGARGVIARNFDPTRSAGFLRAVRHHKIVHGAGRDAVRGAAAARAEVDFSRLEIHALRRPRRFPRPC